MSDARSTMDTSRRLAVLGTAGAILAGLASPFTAAAANEPAPVTVTITQKGGYTAALCAADTLTGGCQEGAKQGQTDTFTVNPQPGSPVEVRVVVNGGASDIKTVPVNGSKLAFETGGSAAKPTISLVNTANEPAMPGMSMSMPMPNTASPAAPARPARGPVTFLTADLTGAQEVPVPGKPAVGAPNGKARAVVEVKGDRVTFGLTWQGISAPTLGHIHQGAAGVNGDVKVGLFGTAMPDTVTAAAGQVTLTDPALAQNLRTNPDGFYLNLHTKEFPGGAVRGQLKPANKRLNVLTFIHGGNLRALDTGNQEVPVPGKPAVGDPDGLAASFLDAHDSTIGFSFAWVNITEPTLAHIHQGKTGANGDVKASLITTPVPANIFAVTGTIKNIDPTLINQIRHNPHNFYTNLHTTDFPGGAVRGQLFN